MTTVNLEYKREKTMKITMRTYRDEDDYWRIRQFLRDVMILNDLREKSWSVARLDYWRWHGLENCKSNNPLEQVTFLWETKAGQIAAVLNPEEYGQVFLQIHPAFKTAKLEEEMVVFAEQNLSINRDNKKKVAFWVDSEDKLRLGLLKARGFKKGKWTESQWRRDLVHPIRDVPVSAGYTIRSLGDESELPARSWASWRGFHPDEPDEKYQGWEWYRNIQRCPLYRHDLDLVAAQGDIIAAITTFWFDDVTRTVYIEPVATVPEHQRRGLARALITEGLKRAQHLGAVRAFVGGYEPAPDALYSSVLSPVCDRSEQWEKEW
jgi:mycothiol synthase